MSCESSTSTSSTLSLITYLTRIKSRFSSLMKETMVLLAFSAAYSRQGMKLDSDTASRDLECGVLSKGVHPMMWYSITYIFRQLRSLNGFPFVSKNKSLAVKQSLQQQSLQPKTVILEDNNAFVDLVTLKIKHRIRSISSGQKYIPKLCKSSSKYKSRIPRMLTGDQLSAYVYPPEPRGENFRKWILVMETLYPNRSLHMRSQRHGSADSRDPGPKTGVLVSGSSSSAGRASIRLC